MAAIMFVKNKTKKKNRECNTIDIKVILIYLTITQIYEIVIEKLWKNLKLANIPLLMFTVINKYDLFIWTK